MSLSLSLCLSVYLSVSLSLSLSASFSLSLPLSTLSVSLPRDACVWDGSGGGRGSIGSQYCPYSTSPLYMDPFNFVALFAVEGMNCKYHFVNHVMGMQGCSGRGGDEGFVDEFESFNGTLTCTQRTACDVPGAGNLN